MTTWCQGTAALAAPSSSSNRRYVNGPPARPCASFACCSCSTLSGVLHSLRSSARHPWLAAPGSVTGTWLAPARLPGAVRRGWRTGLGCVHAVLELAIHGSPASAGARVARGVLHGFGKFTAARWKAEAKQRTSTPTERKWLIGNGSGSGGCHYKTAKRQAKRARPTFPF
jgi:hypothetical protein